MKKSDPKSAAKKPANRSEQLGQVFTPDPIARRMVQLLFENRRADKGPIAILDPCVGPATFPQAMAREGLLRREDTLTVIDLDEQMVDQTDNMMSGGTYTYRSRQADYLRMPLTGEFDCAILNPPYVRQEWIDQKHEYQQLFYEQYGIKIPGTSNLYVYFLVKMIADLKSGGAFVCIVYDSWQSTRYGDWLTSYLKHVCEELTFESISGQPFADRLIDATVISGRKKRQSSGATDTVSEIRTDYELSKGPLAIVQGFQPIHGLFESRRGLRLKQAHFFLCTPADSIEGSTPFVKKIGRIKGFSVPEEHPEEVLLITESEAPTAVLRELERRLERAMLHPEKNISILTWHRERPDMWYQHGKPPHAPLLFNYYLRNRPRHIYNRHRVYSDNFYGLIPRGDVSVHAYLAVLNATAVCTELLANARNQGNGLAKIQLFEYRRSVVPDLTACSEQERRAFHDLGLELLSGSVRAEQTIQKVDKLIYTVFSDSLLRPDTLHELYEEVGNMVKHKGGRC